jgi:hypothetical protein
MWEHIKNTAPEKTVVIGYGGAAGGGKTRGIVELALDCCLDYPGTKVLIGRKDFKDLRTTTMDQFDLHVPNALIYRRNNQEHWREIRDDSWPPGVVSKVFFRELKDWMGLGSEEYQIILIDEAGEVPANSARMLLSRLRWKLPEIIMETEKTPETPWGRATPEFPNGKPVKYIFVACSNPYPGWFKDWFVEGTLTKDPDAAKIIDGNIHFVRALPSDNPALPKDYEAQLRAFWPEDWVKRLMEGRWDAFEGQVYPEFTPGKHEWPGGHKNLPHPKHWEKIIGGLDFGGINPYDHFSAGVVAILLKNGRLIRVEQFEDNGPNVAERQMNWMLEMQLKWCPKNPNMPQHIKWCADKAAITAIQLWQKMGFKVIPSKGGWDSVEVGLAMVKRRMEEDNAGLPGSYYCPEMTTFAERMMSYRLEEPKDDNAPVKRRPVDRKSDLCDADRYMHELVERTFGAPRPGQIPAQANPYVTKTPGPLQELSAKMGVPDTGAWRQREPVDWFDRLTKEDENRNITRPGRRSRIYN